MGTAADKYDQEAASHRAQVRITEETEARLQADPAAQAWLKQFAHDGETFLEGYLEQKIQYLEFGAKYAAHYEAMGIDVALTTGREETEPVLYFMRAEGTRGADSCVGDVVSGRALLRCGPSVEARSWT